MADEQVIKGSEDGQEYDQTKAEPQNQSAGGTEEQLRAQGRQTSKVRQDCPDTQKSHEGHEKDLGEVEYKASSGTG